MDRASRGRLHSALLLLFSTNQHTGCAVPLQPFADCAAGLLRANGPRIGPACLETVAAITRNAVAAALPDSNTGTTEARRRHGVSTGALVWQFAAATHAVATVHLGADSPDRREWEDAVVSCCSALQAMLVTLDPRSCPTAAAQELRQALPLLLAHPDSAVRPN